MANWENTIDFSSEKKQFRNGEIPLSDLCMAASRAVRRAKKGLYGYLDFEGDDIADDFECLADGDATVDDFDQVLTRLYDWADTNLDDDFNGKKVAWVTP